MGSASPSGQATAPSPTPGGVLGDSSELRLHLGPLGRDDEYSVTAQVLPANRTAKGSFRLALSESELGEARDFIERGVLHDPRVQRFGGRLFTLLVRDRIKFAYRLALRAGPLLRCRLLFDDPALQRIPWELLYDPQRAVFLSSAGTVVRDLGPVPGDDGPPLLLPIRLLVADSHGAEGRARVRQLRDAIRPLVESRKLDLMVLAPARSNRLRPLLAAAGRGRAPPMGHVLHLVIAARQWQMEGGVLAVPLRDGGAEDLSSERLDALLASKDLRLVVLDVRSPTGIAAFDTLVKVGPMLLRAGVPAVVGVQSASVETGAPLQRLYGALTDGHPIDAAVAQADPSAAGGRQAPSTSMCFLHGQTGRLAAPTGAAPQPGDVRARRFSWQQAPRRLAATVSALLGLLAALTGLYAFYLDRLAPHPTPPMTGDLNVAVAAFDELDAHGRPTSSEDSAGFAAALERELQNRLAPLAGHGLEVQLRSPAQTGQIKGTGPQQRAERAEERARQLNAHVLIYGTLTYSEDLTTMTPQFYVTPTGMRDAEELTGHFTFGSAVEVFGDASKEAIARLELRRKVVARTQALVQFTLGLGWYRAKQLDEAMKAFAAADRTRSWAPQDGREVLYLFEGNVAGKQRHYRRAELFYRQALKLNPGYARAELGLGEVYLHRAAPSCAPGRADVAGLRRAVAWFEQAQRTPNPPPLSDVPTKAAFQLGRADVCLSQAGAADRWQTARDLFARVVQEYEAGNQRLRELAAESHFGLAVIASSNPAPQDPTSSLREAATQCKQAIALSAEANTRRQVFQAYLDQVNQALGRAGGAPRP